MRQFILLIQLPLILNHILIPNHNPLLIPNLTLQIALLVFRTQIQQHQTIQQQTLLHHQIQWRLSTETRRMINFQQPWLKLIINKNIKTIYLKTCRLYLCLNITALFVTMH